MTTWGGADDLPQKIDGLLEQASGHQNEGRFGEADLLVAEARQLAVGKVRACAEMGVCQCPMTRWKLHIR